MQKFIRQIVLVFRFLDFKFFEGISQFVTPSEAWHDNSDIVWRKKISLNKKQCVESFNIDCLLAWEWPTTTGSPEKRRLTNARGSTEDDQWGVTTQSASDWLKLSCKQCWHLEGWTQMTSFSQIVRYYIVSERPNTGQKGHNQAWKVKTRPKGTKGDKWAISSHVSLFSQTHAWVSRVASHATALDFFEGLLYSV